MEPFISQPGTRTVSPILSATRRSASVLKCRSYAPDAPLRSISATTGSGIPASFGAIIGTFRTSSRPGAASRHCDHGRRIANGPSMPDHCSPGR
ncbi:hypothetical protein ACQP1W_48335 [Spirillospora sp. CA-255316]